MTIAFQRHLIGQTPLGVFQNLFVPGDCDGCKYLALHFLNSRLTFSWGGQA